MNNKVLFIASLNTSKQKYDGERIKSTIMFNCLSELGNLDVINLSRNKIINSLRILFYGLFFKKRYKKVLISKDPHGANIIIKILRTVRFPLNKIMYFEIGPFLYDRILNGSIKRETFFGFEIIVETESMKKELISLGFNNIDVFPNFKPIPNVDFIEQKYPKQTLKLVYFSRINEMKGIYDLIEAINRVNRQRVIYMLDIFGRLESDYDKKRIEALCSKTINYKGKLDLTSGAEYRNISEYDLFAFPTKYSEGFPGSIIDFFIAGVPILSSDFSRAKDILTDDDSYFFKKGSVDDIEKILKEIYFNQQPLSSKRKNSYNRRMEFSTERFKTYISKKI